MSLHFARPASAAGSGSNQSFTYVTSGQTIGDTITPTSVGGQAGELMVVAVGAASSSSTTDATPASLSGWTKGPSYHFTNGSDRTLDGALWFKILDGTENSPVTFIGVTGKVDWIGWARYTITGLSSLAFYSENSEGTAGDPSEQTITLSDLNNGAALALALALTYQMDSNNEITYSLTADNERKSYNGSLSWNFSPSAVNTIPASDATVDMGDGENANVLLSAYIAAA